MLLAGPFKVNGVPLRRVNQAYVIATSTKVDIASVDVAKYSDAYFKRAVTKTKKGESEFFEAEKEVQSIHLLTRFVMSSGIDQQSVVLWLDSVRSTAFRRRRRKTRRLLMPS